MTALPAGIVATFAEWSKGRPARREAFASTPYRIANPALRLQSTMEALAGRLAVSAVVPVEPYSGAHRAALGALERGVLDGTLRHAGDPAIGEQVAWTAVDRFENGDPRRLRKLDRSRPIDAAVAAALAIQGAVLDEGRSVYQERGVLVV